MEAIPNKHPNNGWGRRRKALAEPEGIGLVGEHPLWFPQILENICSHLPFSDLKSTRRVNRRWFDASVQAWSQKSQIRIRDIHHLREFLAKTASLRKVLPYTTTNWIFQGESVTKLWMDQGITEQDLILPFWSSVQSLTLSEWMKRRFRYQQVFPDPARPHYREYRRTPYWVLTRIGSAYAVNSMLKLTNNLTKIVLHYPILTTMKGAYIGPRQFPYLEKLTRLEIYFDGVKWSNEASENPEELMAANLARADQDIVIPQEVSGGNTLVLRLLDHSPNLSSISVSSGTLMTSAVEGWFIRRLLSKGVTLPKLQVLHCSIPMTEEICDQLRIRPWPLKALHLRLRLGINISAIALRDMIASFGNSLKHLELVCVGGVWEGDYFRREALQSLETMEVWGYSGNLDFCRGLHSLKSAVLGFTDQGGYERAEELFKQEPLEGVELELKPNADFILRLDQGPIVP